MASVASFELDWLGGAAERRFRRSCSGVDDLPWGTLDAWRYPAVLVDRARKAWTEGAYFEYCTAAAMSALTRALLEARAPVDLVGMAGVFVADEMLHVELNARMAMELGGAAPCRADFERLLVEPSPGLSALERANELVVRICCVGETFSVPMLNATRRAATHPLTSAVLTRIARDEGPHANLGWLYLDWVEPELDDAERRRLGSVALDALAELSGDWKRHAPSRDVGYPLELVHELGWMEAQSYAALARQVARRRVVEPLKRRGIVLDKKRVAALLS